MIKKIAFSVLLLGLTAGVAQAAPASSVSSAPTSTSQIQTSVATDWGVKRQTVGYRSRGFRHRGFRRGGFGVRRGGYHGYRAYRGGHRFGYRRSLRNYGYGHRGFYGGGRIRGLGSVR